MKRDKLIKEIIEKDSFIFEDPCPLSHQELEEIDSTIESTSSMLDNMKIDSTEDDPVLRFEKIVENLNKSNKSMRVKRNELIFLKDYHNTSKTPCSDWLDHKRVDLYPINENTEIPTDALDPGVWNIPEGYYAIERDLEINPNLFIYSYIFRVILQYYQLSFY